MTVKTTGNQFPDYLGVCVRRFHTLDPSRLMMRYTFLVLSKKYDTVTACLLVGTQFFLVVGSIWKTWARVLKMGCSLWARRGMERNGEERTKVKKSVNTVASVDV